MKIFLDTEFFEYQPNEHGANAVQLISLGAVREDGAEFYAENAEFSWEDIPDDHWLQENVRPHLSGMPPWGAGDWSGRGHDVAGGFYTPSKIAQEFTHFTSPQGSPDFPEFWGYFCDYDWVVLCGLYGRMIDLPPEFPMFCMDLKQEMKRLGVSRNDLPKQPEGNHHALADARWIRDAYNFLPGDGMSDGGEWEYSISSSP